MNGLGVEYRVKEGDTLWDIAAERLGAPLEWPRIFAFNNMPEINALGVRKIDNPDLIFAGEVIRLPILSGMPRENIGGSKVPPPGAARAPQLSAGRPQSLRDALAKTDIPFAVAYNIEQTLVFQQPTHTVRIKLSGKLTVRLGKKVPVTYVVNKGLSVRLKSETDAVYAKLISQTSYGFDLATKKISFSNMMITKADNIYVPKTAIGLAVNSTSPMPVLKGEIIYPTLEGSIGIDSYLVTDFKIIIEIEMRPPALAPKGVPVIQPGASRDFQPAQNRGINWYKVGAYTAAGVITVGFAAWVYCSGGLGTVNTPQYTYVMSVILAMGIAAPTLTQGGKYVGIK